MSKILALDYGRRRTGVAISDSGRKLAFPRKTIVYKKPHVLIAEVKKLCEQEEIGLIVIGLPLNMKGNYTPQTESTASFADELKKEVACPIEFSDERLSTLQAERTLIDKGIKKYSEIDGIAAQIVLQAWLDKHKNV